jgi:hypothetical protein
MATLQQVCDYNKNRVNWIKMYSMIDTLGTTMNSQKDRFDKSDLIEMGLEVYSNSGIKYINQPGIDHELVNLLDAQGMPVTQEMKFVSTLFYKDIVIERANRRRGIKGTKELQRSNQPVTIKLVNSMGSNTHTKLPATYAKFLLVADNNSAHVIEIATLLSYLVFGGDGITAVDVPSNLFTQVIGPDDITTRQPLANFNYKTEKLIFQRDFLNRF